MQQTIIPIVDLENTKMLKNACEQYGIFYLPIPEEYILTLRDIITYSQKFFAGSEDEKNRHLMTSNGLGYTPFRHNKNIVTSESYAINCSEKCENSKIFIYAKIIFQKILTTLNLNIEYDTSNIILLLHYLSVSGGISSHTDWGFLTILYTTADGLQIYHDNKWKDVPTLENHFIVNIGDMLEVLTGGKYLSPLHKVVAKSEKYSIAFFLDPHTDSIIRPYIDNTKYAPIRYGDHKDKKINRYAKLNKIN